MNFKVGDKVKIKDNLKEIEDFAGSYISELEKYVGQILTVQRIEGNAVFLIENRWTWDIRALEKQFTKSDLKDGDIVTYRNENKKTIKGNRLIDENGIVTNQLGIYNDDLIHKNIKENDIVKVEHPTQYETVFERKEEILDKAEKRYLRNVIRPFRDKVRYIEKEDNGEISRIKICLDYHFIFFPNLEKEKRMYEGMKANRSYRIEELGL